MNKNILNFLTEYSKEPQLIDRLFVSSFVSACELHIKKNRFLRNYIIRPTDKEEYLNLLLFLDLLEKNNFELDFENLIELFEFVVSPEDRVINGAVYTPKVIRNNIVENGLKSFSQKNDLTIVDISCGCGGFLYTAAKRLKTSENTYYSIFKNQIFGLDIQEYSVIRTKILLALLAVSEGEDREAYIFNIHEGDALEFKWQNVVRDYEGFDMVVGNPPYVCSRNILDASKKHLKNWSVCNVGHPDLYIPFFQIGLENLKPNGFLGYITMNSFFKSLNGRELRKYFTEKSYFFSIVDFSNTQVFKSRSTYTCICNIIKRASDHVSYKKCESLENLHDDAVDFFPISYSDLNDFEGWNLNKLFKVISRIEQTGTAFSKKYKTRNGIATLKNDVYIFSPKRTDKSYFYLVDGQTEYPIEKGVCRDILNPNTLINKVSIEEIKEKIIFPYHVTENVISAFEEDYFRSVYPEAYKYLSSKKDTLSKRDKGLGAEYTPWYIFGRNQSLEKLHHKLFFPHITPRTPHYYLDSDENLLFYNGLAVIGKTKRELLILKKILSSKIFWFYISNTSKPYSSSYYSLSKNYIKNFGIPKLTTEEEEYLLSERSQDCLDLFFSKKYGVDNSMLSNM